MMTLFMFLDTDRLVESHGQQGHREARDTGWHRDIQTYILYRVLGEEAYKHRDILYSLGRRSI